MSNIKVKGRVFRNVEKMDVHQLGEVRRHLVMAIQGHAKEGLRMQTGAITPAVRSKMDRMDGEVQVWNNRLRTVDGLAKVLLRKETAEKLQQQTGLGNGQATQASAGA